MCQYATNRGYEDFQQYLSTFYSRICSISADFCLVPVGRIASSIFCIFWTSPTSFKGL